MHTLLPDSIVVGGASIRYGVSGSGDRDLILVHGSGAHHMWWHAIAPALEEEWRVITLDLSGHGDSDHRSSYEPSHWVEEIRAVLDATGADRPVYAGHSMGGRAGISFAAEHPDRTRGLVIFDASIRPPARYRTPKPAGGSAPKIYADYADALSRFRLLPRQPAPAPEMLEPLGLYSLKEVEGGWTWKHDPRALLRFKDAELDAAARKVICPMVYVYGLGSVVVNEELAQYAAQAVQGPAEIIRLDQAYHHVILDAPEACASIIDSAAARFYSQ